MASVKRTGKGSKASLRTRKKKAVEDDGDALPLEYVEPGGELNDFSILIHGVIKIGKTTMANQTEDPDEKVLFLQLDPEQRTMRRLEELIGSWADFRVAVRKLTKLAAKKRGVFPYTRVVLDRVDMWYKYCQTHVCEELGISYPGELNWGEGWEAVKKEFSQGVRELLAIPCGRWFLCHSTWREVETRDGNEIQRLEPNVTKTADGVLNGLLDATFAYDYVGTQRVLVIQGSEKVVAGHRINGHFTTLKGKTIRNIDMLSSPEESYAQLLKAFRNQLTKSKYKRPV